jgi:3-dehydroquinate dehydratase-1
MQKGVSVIVRPESKSPVITRGKVLGGALPLICLPLVAGEKSSLIMQAGENAALKPDMIEWRVDSFEEAENLKEMTDALLAVRNEVSNIPLIFTCRYIKEGGFREISQDMRIKIINAALETGEVDLIDFEISNGNALVAQIKESVRKSGAKLILSYHNFQETPEEEFIYNKLLEAGSLGADVAKLAVMPAGFHDVLKLLNATLRAREEALEIPIITMSMGEIGKVTRIAGGYFGSDLTFAVGKESSAPGQVPVADLRSIWKVLTF